MVLRGFINFLAFEEIQDNFMGHFVYYLMLGVLKGLQVIYAVILLEVKSVLLGVMREKDLEHSQGH